jgi:hypothetical protein
MTRSRCPAIPRAIALKDRFIFKTEMDDEARPAAWRRNVPARSRVRPTVNWRAAGQATQHSYLFLRKTRQLNFPKKFISLWTRRHAASFARALLRHTQIINLFHVAFLRK